jgi:hypothetical protein
MKSRRRIPITWIFALSAILLATRLTNDHLHLCFDGSEPPITLHSIDDGDHPCPGDTEDRDTEVDLPDFTPVKAKPSLAGEPLIVPTMWCLAIATREAQTPETSQPTPHPTAPDYLRPPTRAPPASLPA